MDQEGFEKTAVCCLHLQTVETPAMTPKVLEYVIHGLIREGSSSVCGSTCTAAHEKATKTVYQIVIGDYLAMRALEKPFMCQIPS